MNDRKINQKKFEIFLKVANGLNEKFDFAPILFALKKIVISPFEFLGAGFSEGPLRQSL